MTNRIRTMLLAVVMMISTAATAQTTITEGEYWIDGNINSRQALTSGATIDIGALQPGLHTLTVRVKDSNGLWSNQMARLFFVMPNGHTDATSVTACEYWIDSKKVSSATTLNTQVIDISDLKPGLHQLMVRVKDNLDIWSNQMTRIFYVMSDGRTDATNVTACEYWIDSKKVSSATTLNTQVIDISDLTPGLHQLMVRVKDNLGIWSNQMTRTFYVMHTPSSDETTLVSYMYWIDDDKVNIVQGSLTSGEGSLVIDLGEIADGDHILSWRVSDSKGAWSEVFKKSFISGFIPGDANNDKTVNVTDIVAVVNYIMENPVSGFNILAADVNKDGEVNVSDIVAIVNIIMSSGSRMDQQEVMTVLKQYGFIFKGE